jgi:hypothetical protein
VRSLVVFYWLTGKTRLVANNVSALLEADVERVICGVEYEGTWGFIRAAHQCLTGSFVSIAPPKFSPANYDLVVVGCPIWAGYVPPPIRTYLHQYSSHLHNTAYFVTHEAASPGRALERMASISGKRPIATASISAQELRDGSYESAARHFAADITLTLGRLVRGRRSVFAQ